MTGLRWRVQPLHRLKIHMLSFKSGATPPKQGAEFIAAFRRWPRFSYDKSVCLRARAALTSRAFGEVSEWFKEHAWKACIG